MSELKVFVKLTPMAEEHVPAYTDDKGKQKPQAWKYKYVQKGVEDLDGVEVETTQVLEIKSMRKLEVKKAGEFEVEQFAIDNNLYTRIAA
jgi:hypothetical protein